MAEAPAELARARTVQEAMLPQAPVLAGLEIASSYRACDLVGGDFFDYVVVDPGRLGFVMADVSGHGTAAALLMAAAKKALQLFGRGCASPREALLAANENLQREIPRGMFVSVFYGVLDLAKRRFAFVRAGHNPLVLVRGGAVRTCKPEGTVLGALPNTVLAAHLKEEEVQLETGDLLMIYTDGLTEAVNPSDAMYGETRLHRAMTATTGSAREMIAGLIRDVDAFRAGTARNDDEARVALRLLEAPAEPPVLGGDELAAQGNLPAGTARLVGRDRELAEMLALLTGTIPVLTVTGAAGMGKTRLALGAALLAQASFRAGAWLADLGDERDLEGICKQVANALGVDLSRGEPVQRIALALQGRTRTRQGRLLLVLDNCDHCREAVLHAVQAWQQAAPGVVVLATCRSALGAPAERPYPLRPLGLPPRKATGRLGPVDEAELRTLAAVPAVALFATRARERVPEFDLTPENADAVAQLCVRLDGIPLALELAAARARVLTPAQMLQRLNQRFALLRDQRGGSRQSTLQGALAWSWDLLTPAEKATLAQLSVFRGGFFLELAEQVVDLSSQPDAPLVMDVVESLHDKSLLEVQEIAGLGGERRFWMFESVRDYAHSQLADPAAVQARWRHALVARCRADTRLMEAGVPAEPRLRVQLEAEALAEICRAAEDEDACWAGLIGGSALTRLGLLSGSRQLMERAYRLAPPGELKERATVALGQATLYSDPSAAESLLRSVPRESPRYTDALLALGNVHQNRGNGPLMLEVMEELSARPGLTPLQKARILAGRGSACLMCGDVGEALRCYNEALVAGQGLGDAMLTGQVIGNMGVAHNMLGDRDEAVEYFNRALVLIQAQGHHLAESYWLVNLGSVLMHTGKLAEAERHLRRALVLGRENGLRLVESSTLITLAAIEEKRGNLERAEEDALQACRVDEEMGNSSAHAPHLSFLLWVRYRQGRREGFLDGLRKTVVLCEGIGNRAGAAEQTYQLAEGLLSEYRREHNPALLAEAREVLDKSRGLFASIGNPDPVTLSATLADILLEAGDTAGARQAAERALARKPSSTSEEEGLQRAQEVLKKLGA
ncbi:MAG: SpoIIE family protein phosphatase [Planctomycetes bacterium]|nr:SpoIIE family protein phosphatase [Planctomycetota bacterium]